MNFGPKSAPEYPDDEPVYRTCDKFFTRRKGIMLKSYPTETGEESTDVLIPPGYTIEITEIHTDQRGESEAAAGSIKEMVVFLIDRRHDHGDIYATCKITPKEMCNFRRERRTSKDIYHPLYNKANNNEDGISDKRLNQLTGGRHIRVREPDTAEQMRQLIIAAMRVKFQRKLSKI